MFIIIYITQSRKFIYDKAVLTFVSKNKLMFWYLRD